LGKLCYNEQESFRRKDPFSHFKPHILNSTLDILSGYTEVPCTCTCIYTITCTFIYCTWYTIAQVHCTCTCTVHVYRFGLVFHQVHSYNLHPLPPYTIENFIIVTCTCTVYSTIDILSGYTAVRFSTPLGASIKNPGS